MRRQPGGSAGGASARALMQVARVPLRLQRVAAAADATPYWYGDLEWDSNSRRVIVRHFLQFRACRWRRRHRGIATITSTLRWPRKKRPASIATRPASSGAVHVRYKSAASHSTLYKRADQTGAQRARTVALYAARIIVLVAMLYIFVCSLGLLTSAFRLVGGKTAGDELPIRRRCFDVPVVQARHWRTARCWRIRCAA